VYITKSKAMFELRGIYPILLNSNKLRSKVIKVKNLNTQTMGAKVHESRGKQPRVKTKDLKI